MTSLKYPHDSEQPGTSERGDGTWQKSDSAGRFVSIQTAGQAQQEYLGLIEDIPEVVKVLLVEEDEGLSLVTVISATPFDNLPRNKVLDVQVDLMRRMEKPLLGFHLMNIQELPGGSLEYQGMRMSQVIWSR